MSRSPTQIENISPITHYHPQLDRCPQNAISIPAPTTAAAANDPEVLDAAPVKVGFAVEPVPVGAMGEVGTIGEPVAVGPVTAPVEPTVPVAKPVDAAAAPEELIMVVLLHEHSVS